MEFNAHRVFYPSTVIECFSELTLQEFSCTAEGKIEYNVDIHKYDNDAIIVMSFYYWEEIKEKMSKNHKIYSLKEIIYEIWEAKRDLENE